MARRVVISLTAAALATLVFAASAQALRVSRLVAPTSVCKNQGDSDAPASVQEQAMRCLTNYARSRAHRGRFGKVRKLDRSAGMKSRDIVRCDSFSHSACGRDFTYWMRRVGYLRTRCWRAGENIAWGSGSGYASPRAIFFAWMRSPAHRANILSRSFDQIGIGLRIGPMGGYSRAHVWTQHFGDRC